MPRYVGIDPGGTTGVACLHVKEVYGEDRHILSPEHDELHWSWQHIGPDDHHARLGEYLDYTNPLRIACEQFEWRPNRHENKEYGDKYVLLISREYIGVTKLWVAQHPGTHLSIQAAGLAKPFVTNDVLKRLDLWVPGDKGKHAMDAFRHLLYDLTRPNDPSGKRLELLKAGWK